MLAPVALISWRTARRATWRAWSSWRPRSTLLLTATLVTFAAADLTLGFAPLPVIVWAAVRFRERVVVIEQIAYATAVTLFTQYGCGSVRTPSTPARAAAPSTRSST